VTVPLLSHEITFSSVNNFFIHVTKLYEPLQRDIKRFLAYRDKPSSLKIVVTTKMVKNGSQFTVHNGFKSFKQFLPLKIEETILSRSAKKLFKATVTKFYNT
jgi:hypothetical protein